MKVCLTNNKGTWSTAHTGKGKFVQRLIPALQKVGIEVTQDTNEDVDIDLQLGKWNYEPRRAKKAVIRLGPAHVDTSQKYKKLNKLKWASVKRVDGIIYQSRYSERVCHKFIGKPRCPETIIFNGADPDYYKKIAPLSSNYKYNFLASTRVWIPQKRLNCIIKSFLMAEIPNSCLWVCGDTSKTKITAKANCGNIRFLGSVDDKTVGALYRLCDLMIHLVYLDACPNSVVEALVAGGQVICTNQGGTPELMQGADTGIVVSDKEYKFKPIDLSHPPKVNREAVVEAITMLEYRGRQIPYVPRLHIDHIAQRYWEFFEGLLMDG